jgi:hypothetical protein
MSTKQRWVGFDYNPLTDKILVDDDEVLGMPAIIASEIVQEYEDGYAYKPADELEQMAHHAQLIGSVPVKVQEHPGIDTFHLLVRHGDIHGRATNFQFVKNLKDPKTGRPMRRGVTADIYWYKSRVSPDLLNQVRSGVLRDNSIGFTHDKDWTPGEFHGAQYDYVQRNIFLQHIAAPIPAGRCPGPICGIGYDTSLKYGMDQVELSQCPICQGIVDVGLKVASARLYRRYGIDVFNVIKNIPDPRPQQVLNQEDDLTTEFHTVYRELQSRLRPVRDTPPP